MCGDSGIISILKGFLWSVILSWCFDKMRFIVLVIFKHLFRFVYFLRVTKVKPCVCARLSKIWEYTFFTRRKHIKFRNGTIHFFFLFVVANPRLDFVMLVYAGKANQPWCLNKLVKMSEYAFYKHSHAYDQLSKWCWCWWCGSIQHSEESTHVLNVVLQILDFSYGLSTRW